MNILPALFGTCPKPVRLIETADGQIVVPVVDVATALGYRRIVLHRILDRNRDQFAGLEIEVAVTATSSAANFFAKTDMLRPVRCLTREGLVGLLMKLTAIRIADPERRARIVAFQRWAMRAIVALLDGTLPPEFNIPLAAHAALHRLGQKGEHVRQLAAQAGRNTDTIYRWIRKAKIQAGVPLRKTRSDKGIPRPTARAN